MPLPFGDIYGAFPLSVCLLRLLCTLFFMKHLILCNAIFIDLIGFKDNAELMMSLKLWKSILIIQLLLLKNQTDFFCKQVFHTLVVILFSPTCSSSLSTMAHQRVFCAFLSRSERVAALSYQKIAYLAFGNKYMANRQTCTEAINI